MSSRDIFLGLLPGWPEEASTSAWQVDRIVIVLLAVSLLLVAILAGMNLYFLVRYRRGSSAPRPPLKMAEWKVEATWIMGTTAGFLGFFFWGAHTYLEMERPPSGAEEIHVVGRQWMWDIRQPNGRREFDELHVPIGKSICLLLTSEDVIHSFFVPAFRLKQDVVPGKEVSLWFNATKAGRFPFYCSEFCGTKHAEMTGVVVAETPERYAAWLAEGGGGGAGWAEGRRLFVRFGCSGCHSPGASVRAPLLDGLYGRQVPLAGGGFARVDEQFLRDCILLPNRRPPAGYPLIMPSFQGVIREGELLDLIAYLKTKGESAGAEAGEPNP